MPKILLHVVPPPADADPQAESFCVFDERISVSRVPCVGELIGYQLDGKGHMQDYKVVIVYHTIGVDYHADVYAVRVFAPSLITEAYRSALEELRHQREDLEDE